MALNGLHLIGLLDTPPLEEDVPEPIKADWMNLVAKWKALNSKDHELECQKTCRKVRMRLGKRDPYPELAEVDPEPKPLEL